MIGLWITAAVCVVLAILFFCGKCGFLIMHYNVASPEEKAKYHKKRLFRAMGVFMLVVAALTVALALFFEQLRVIYAYAVAVAILICVFYVMGFCKEKDEPAEAGEDQE